jgi:hypothetical protein
MFSLLDLCPLLSSAPDTGQGVADAALEPAPAWAGWDCDRAMNGRSAPGQPREPRASSVQLSTPLPAGIARHGSPADSRSHGGGRRAAPRDPVEPYATVRNRPFLQQPPLPRRLGRQRCPESVSEINVAQLPLSEGCETVTGMGHLLGDARVSTTDQQPQLQVDALKAAGCYRVFTETASGARTDRPTLTQVLDQLRPGDTLVVWKLDRLGRSLRHLVDTVTGLAERGIGFRSLQERDRHHHPRRQARLPRLRRLGRVRTRPHPRTHHRRAGRGANSRPPGRPTIGADGPQAAGGGGDVPLRAVHSQRDRHHLGSQPRLDLPPRVQRWRLANRNAGTPPAVYKTGADHPRRAAECSLCRSSRWVVQPVRSCWVE